MGSVNVENGKVQWRGLVKM